MVSLLSTYDTKIRKIQTEFNENESTFSQKSQLSISKFLINFLMLKSTSLNFISIKRMHIWDQEFKNRQSRICGRQSFKNLEGYGLPKADYFNFSFKFFKGCLPQTLSGPFLNTLSHIFLGILSTDCEVDIFDHFFS